MIINYFVTISFSILGLIIIYLYLDYRGPARIFIQKDNVFGMSCERAGDLIVQEYDKEGNLWATRGMIIYMLKLGDNCFCRVAHVPAGLSIFWLYNFTIFRKLSLRPECMEIVISRNGSICAFAGGSLWYLSDQSDKFVQTKKIRHYGLGIGRGMLSNGIFCIENRIFFGEYFYNQDKTNVFIYKSMDSGLTWKIAHEFLPGQIRHIHSLLSDPYTDKVWQCTGDLDNESMIAWSNDNYVNYFPIIYGNQAARAISLVFTEDAVYWGTDTSSKKLAGIYKWDKEKNEITKLLDISAAIFYGTRLAGGTIVMSSETEGSPLESDDITRLFLINNNKIASIECGSWNVIKKGLRFSPGRLRCQRNQGSNFLAITCLNQKEVSNGELIIVSEESLLSLTKSEQSQRY